MEQYYQSYSRPQMRFYFGGKMTPVVLGLLIANGAMFVAQQFFADGLTRPLGLSIDNFAPWQFITSLFLHDTDNAGHIILNMLALFMFGKDVERSMKSIPFTALYFTAGIAGGLCHLALSAITGETHTAAIGASGAIFGILMAFAYYYPNRQIWFIPVRYFVWGYIAFETIMMVVASLAPGSSDGVAHIAHIGGALWGLAFLRARPWWNKVMLTRKRRRATDNADGYRRKRRRVDELLEKINREGIASLTDKERDFLKKASRDYRN